MVQRVRLRYAKRGRLRFSSHRDFQRALERALRRCQVPMAYSAGFTPHPKISYAGAAPTGSASEAEYVELGLAQRCDLTVLTQVLDAALPAGLDIVEMVESRGGALADRLQASVWRFDFSDPDPTAVADALQRFWGLSEAPVERVTKAGRRQVDARGAVLAWRVEGTAPAPSRRGSAPERETSGLAGSPVGGPSSPGNGPCAILHLVVRHTTPSVRPDDILTALRSMVDLAPATPVLVTRLAQGPVDAGGTGVADPLAADRVPLPSSDDASLQVARTET